jgi:MBG domain (YGX type)
MQKKAFIFTALLSGLGTLLFGQKTQANSSFLCPNQVGTAYTPASFAPSGGTAPEPFSALPDFLPPGTSSVSSGALPGIPTAEGSLGPVAPLPLVFSPTTIPDGLYGSAYANQSLTVTGGMPPYTFSVSGGTMPRGISLSADGVLSGTPTAAGKYSFTVTAQDNGRGRSRSTGSREYVLIIDQAVLTITANDANKLYGGALPALMASYSGFVNGDRASGLSKPPAITTTATSSSPAGSYAITPSGASDPNYTISYVAGTLTIIPATLTITVNSATMTYGGTVPSLGLSYTGFVNGDKVSSLTTPPTITTTATSSSSAGVYPIAASGAIDPNYSFTYSSGTLAVNPASLLVTTIAQEKEYAMPDPTFTYTATGFLNGDNSGIFTGSLSRAPGDNVGTYPITEGSLSAGSNYTIIYTGNYLTITAASQKITWTQSLLVGCSATTQVQLTATASSGLPVTYSVSNGNIATVSGNVLTVLQPGTNVVIATQAGDANHTAAPDVTDTVFYQGSSLIRQHWGDAIFFDNSSGDYVAWQWYKNDSLVAGATSPYYSETPSLNGQYFVVATNKDGQQVQSCTLTITGGAPIPGSIKVQPNPANKGALVTVTSNYSSAALQGAVLQIIDITGRVRQQLTNVQPSIQVTMPSENGLYIINLVLANGGKSSINVLVVD